jgi:hypothetical protein
MNSLHVSAINLHCQGVIIQRHIKLSHTIYIHNAKNIILKINNGINKDKGIHNIDKMVLFYIHDYSDSARNKQY